MDVEWETYPVLHFDFTSENYNLEDGLERMLDTQLSYNEDKYGIESKDYTTAHRFSRLIRATYEQTRKKVVILVDGFEDPLLTIIDNKELLKKNEAILNSFYGNLKSLDSMIHYAFLTGVARFSNQSIYSDLNNIDDISMEYTFADICGWTEDEVVNTFRPAIDTLAKEKEEDFETTLTSLRDFYGGYKFTAKGFKLYCPCSILRAFEMKSIDVDSDSSATVLPAFIAQKIKAQGIYPPDINGVKCDKRQLAALRLGVQHLTPLMFKTGYLTIASYIEDIDLYTLRFPNREVEIGFYKYLLPIYAPETAEHKDLQYQIEKLER